MCALLIGSLCCPHKRLVLGISYVCFRSETPHLVKGSICVHTEIYLHKGSSPELDVPLLFYVEVLGFERLEGDAVSLHDMAA